MKVISGTFRGRNLKSLKGTLTRPTMGKVKEAVFSSINDRVAESVWLDLFAGSGSIGIEAISRGAKFVWFVERDKMACRTISDNLANLGIDKSRGMLINTDALKACRKLADQKALVDIAYIDPPYQNINEYHSVLEAITPLLVPNALIIVEHDPTMSLQSLGLILSKTKTYGSSAVSYYLYEGGNEN